MSDQSTVGVVIITFAITFILTLTVTAIITFFVTYLCVKRTLDKTNSAANLRDQSPVPQEKVIYV